MPPMLAPRGMARAKAILPFPLAGSVFRTGARKVSIMAAVAVLLRNMENNPVTSRKPSKTFSDFVPKGLSKTFASLTSSPLFVAAIARMKPPMKSMMMGFAKQAMMALYERTLPNCSSGASRKKRKALSLQVNNKMTMIATEVVHDGIASVTHIKVAKQKTAMTRCSTIVNPSIPNTSAGKNHNTMPTTMAISSLISLESTLSLRFFFLLRW